MRQSVTATAPPPISCSPTSAGQLGIHRLPAQPGRRREPPRPGRTGAEPRSPRRRARHHDSARDRPCLPTTRARRRADPSTSGPCSPIGWRGSTTGANRIRAGFPADWKVVDKTGTGDYGRANDVAVVWSPNGEAYVVAIMSDRAGGGYDAEPSEALVAGAATLCGRVAWVSKLPGIAFGSRAVTHNPPVAVDTASERRSARRHCLSPVPAVEVSPTYPGSRGMSRRHLALVRPVALSPDFLARSGIQTRSRHSHRGLRNQPGGGFCLPEPGRESGRGRYQPVLTGPSAISQRQAWAVESGVASASDRRAANAGARLRPHRVDRRFAPHGRSADRHESIRWLPAARWRYRRDALCEVRPIRSRTCCNPSFVTWACIRTRHRCKWSKTLCRATGGSRRPELSADRGRRAGLRRRRGGYVSARS